MDYLQNLFGETKMEAIHKSKLVGKYVSFLDKDGKQRTQKVTKIVGNKLTVKDCLGTRKRIYLDDVRGRQLKKGIQAIAGV